MATISFTIPDAVLTRVENALCAQGSYNAASGLTQAQFSKQMITNFIMQAVRSYEAQQAVTNTYQTAVDKVNNDIDIS